MNCEYLEPEVFEDHRGVIRSFYPDEAVVEYNLMTIKKGEIRGYHYHPHFHEYMLVVHGCCMFTELTDKPIKKILYEGDSIRIPIGTAHSFEALEDMKFVSMLTRKWHSSDPPIVKVDDNGHEVTS